MSRALITVPRLKRRPPRSRPVIDFYASGLLHTEKDFQGVTIVGGKPGIIAAYREISRRQAEEALTDPVFARRLFKAKFRTTDPVIAMADHMLHRMQQVPVPEVGEVSQ